MEKFNCKIAKNVPLEHIMKHFNIAVERKKSDNLWYLSPFKSEKTASFKVNTTHNIWYDFSIGTGGDTIKFMEKLQKCDTSKALELLKKFEVDFFSFQQPKEILKPNGIEILKIGDIRNSNLINYLSTRGIYEKEAFGYCKEIIYLNYGKVYQSIGFENQSNGFELRNEKFKSCFGKKDITFFDNNSENLTVFEGFIDFLSFLMLDEFRINNSNWLILNSLALINRIESYLINHKLTYLFLDNDLAGKTATSGIISKYSNQIDMSIFYANHKDLNDYLIYKLQNQ